ncbi:MAG: hopanoid biosynthesis associated radical SAM protein HpnH, partial [Geminicoccaceae bacterium]
EGPMAPEIDLSKQRPAEYVFSRHVQEKLAELKHKPRGEPQVADAAE